MGTLFPIRRLGRTNANYNTFDALSMLDDLFTTDIPSRSHRSYNTTPRANVIKTDAGDFVQQETPEKVVESIRKVFKFTSK